MLSRRRRPFGLRNAFAAPRIRSLSVSVYVCFWRNGGWFRGLDNGEEKPKWGKTLSQNSVDREDAWIIWRFKYTCRGSEMKWRVPGDIRKFKVVRDSQQSSKETNSTRSMDCSNIAQDVKRWLQNKFPYCWGSAPNYFFYRVPSLSRAQWTFRIPRPLLHSLPFLFSFLWLSRVLWSAPSATDKFTSNQSSAQSTSPCFRVCSPAFFTCPLTFHCRREALDPRSPQQIKLVSAISHAFPVSSFYPYVHLAIHTFPYTTHIHLSFIRIYNHFHLFRPLILIWIRACATPAIQMMLHNLASPPMGVSFLGAASPCSLSTSEDCCKRCEESDKNASGEEEEKGTELMGRARLWLWSLAGRQEFIQILSVGFRSNVKKVKWFMWSLYGAGSLIRVCCRVRTRSPKSATCSDAALESNVTRRSSPIRSCPNLEKTRRESRRNLRGSCVFHRFSKSPFFRRFQLRTAFPMSDLWQKTQFQFVRFQSPIADTIGEILEEGLLLQLIEMKWWDVYLGEGVNTLWEETKLLFFFHTSFGDGRSG